jgi:hypothetical protein
VGFGFVTKQLNHSDLFFCTLTALKSLAVALAMPVFFALLAHKITSPALPNLFRNKAFEPPAQLRGFHLLARAQLVNSHLLQPRKPA